MVDVVVCVDGLDPAYLDTVETPGWDAITTRGGSGTCSCAIPSLTNVNNVGIVTGVWPIDHGITGNSYYDPDRGDLVYMDDPSFVTHPTVFERTTGDSAALFVKQKLEAMAGQGAAVTMSAEAPPESMEAALGPAPDIYSGGASAWILDAAIHLLETRSLDIVYVSTTDVVPHKHAPGEAAAADWVRSVDTKLHRLLEVADNMGVTADHGMRHKTTCIDLKRVLSDAGCPARVIPLIRDEHTYHHQNLGGAAYVEFDDSEAVDELRALEGVTAVYGRREAAAEFNLPAERIGDALVLGSEHAVFGPVDDGHTRDVDLRSHGSTTEQRVPYALTRPAELQHNHEIFAHVTESAD